jgi:hypothetical protein
MRELEILDDWDLSTIAYKIEELIIEVNCLKKRE